MSGPIKMAERLLGVKFWAQHYKELKPRFEVYKYVGYQADTGTHFFAAVKAPHSIVGKNIYQIQSGYFKPFCIDHALITQAVDGEGKLSAYL